MALAALERLDEAGVATYLNTNGWFVDDAVADRLAALRGLHVYVSVDGANAGRHDALRGVPGSWKRALAGAARLLDRGVPVRITHVVTPHNGDEVPDALRAFARLGALSTHLAPVAPIGAAARGGDWAVDRMALRVTRDAGRSSLGGMNVEVRGGEYDDFNPFTSAPATFLVRPDGVVRISSSVPFSFGHVDEGVAACWERIRAGWDAPEVRRWLDSVKRRSRLPEASVVPYLDADAPVGDTAPAPTAGGRAADRPAASALSRPDPLAGTPAALEHVTALALGRRYRLGTVRWTEGDRGQRFVRQTATGAVTKLNPTAATVMEACAGGSAADAVDLLAARHPGTPRDVLVDDTVAALRLLLARRILVPALAPEGARAFEAATPAASVTA